jgi:hypothetical protein
MKTKILVFFALFSYDLYCQSFKPDIIAASGDEGNTGEFSMVWTLGETFIFEYSNIDFTLSQGFHQNFNNIPTTFELPSQNIDIDAYPNPVTDLLTVAINVNANKQWKYEIYDARGIFMANGYSEKTSFEIDFTSYQSGTYLLRISNKDFSKLFHIIKIEAYHEKI